MYLKQVEFQTDLEGRKAFKCQQKERKGTEGLTTFRLVVLTRVCVWITLVVLKLLWVVTAGGVFILAPAGLKTGMLSNVFRYTEEHPKL
jgi:hypothetical protein